MRYRFSVSAWAGDDLKTATGVLHARNRDEAYKMAMRAGKLSAKRHGLASDVDVFYLRKIRGDARVA